VVDDELQCGYHGWRYAPEGSVTAIPALGSKATLADGAVYIEPAFWPPHYGSFWGSDEATWEMPSPPSTRLRYVTGSRCDSCRRLTGFSTTPTRPSPSPKRPCANGVADDCRTSPDLAALLDLLDRAAWSLQEMVDLGNATYDEYVVAFRKARAVNAWMIITDDASLAGCCASLYEALHALDGDEERVVTLLT
jgi:hypothetical protein